MRGVRHARRRLRTPAWPPPEVVSATAAGQRAGYDLPVRGVGGWCAFSRSSRDRDSAALRLSSRRRGRLRTPQPSSAVAECRQRSFLGTWRSGGGWPGAQTLRLAARKREPFSLTTPPPYNFANFSPPPICFPCVSPARSLVPCPSRIGAFRGTLVLSWPHDGVVVRARRGSCKGGSSASTTTSPARGSRSLLCACRKTNDGWCAEPARCAELSDRAARQAEGATTASWWHTCAWAKLVRYEAWPARRQPPRKKRHCCGALAQLSFPCTPSSCAGSQTTRSCLAPSRKKI